MNIYIVNGAPRSGKDTFIDNYIETIHDFGESFYKINIVPAVYYSMSRERKEKGTIGNEEKYLSVYTEYRKKGYKYSVIQPIKDILKEKGVLEKTPAVRQLMSEMKDELDREGNFTRKKVRKEIEQAYLLNYSHLFIIARELTDIKKIKSLASQIRFINKIKTFFIVGKNQDNSKPTRVDSFDFLDNLDYDYTILNLGTEEEFKETVKNLYLKIEGGKYFEF